MLPSIQTREVSCNTCGTDAAVEVARSRDYEFNTCSNEFVFVRCTGCGHVYLRNRPLLSELATIYPPSYYQFAEHLGPRASRLRGLSQRTKLAPLRRHCRAGAVIADVGCGSGDLLQAAKQYGDPGWRLIGVDFSPDACAHLDRMGIENRCAIFETMTWDTDRPDALVMNQVIEHLDDPRASVAKAYDLLAPGGVLILETPSTDAWDARWFFDRYWGGWHCPRHWHLYTPETLGELLRRQGFEVIETAFLLNPYTWLHSLRNVVTERLGYPRVGALFSERSVMALAAVSTLDVLQRAVRGRTSNMRIVGRK
jgi:SAM-dependent methyltransferase